MGKIITFLGPVHSGRTTIVLNTAYILAKGGSKILIVDADQTMGNIGAHLSLEEKDIGLAEAVSSADKNIWEKCFVKHKKTGLTLLTLPGTAKSNGLFGVTTAQAKAFFQKAILDFDFIFVDTGNILYEALSGYALVCAERSFLVLPQEQRGRIWMGAMGSVLDALDIPNLRIILTNLYEIPEISDGLLNGGKETVAFPCISNMRDYMLSRNLYMQSPSGKKLAEYKKKIQEVLNDIRS